MLEKHLATKFGPVRKIATVLLMSKGIVLKAENHSFTVLLDRSKYGNDEWILLIGVLDGQSLVDRLRKKAPTGYVEEQKLVCREVHDLLSSAPEVSELRWYFEGFHSQGSAVATPDELLWD